ncbi:alpha/beta hydrolase family protein [Phenylobacterium kunshanense]|uniref:Peptidase S9 prolyl oligopeptidase catalytic domain-containing protein n=1 Tax=Phenylobacterium kunshanense TaxID=1445034 RepID=A0A328BGZ3_9CAUL|nr:prolyl oligopeptidase family serine peptidase [Phenylobacterium kunshanense]RAK66383.1 hypothetical protein DJ019_09050 [Phenylobacterium kunshanense]
MRTPRRRCGLLAAAALMALACAHVALGRALTVEDVLQREAFGRVELAERWLFVEAQGPYASAARFDYDSRTDLFRTRLQVAPLSAPAQLRPLVPREPGVGYALGPVSPCGDRAAVFRLKAGRWELGVAEAATGATRWLNVAPLLTATGRAVAWQDAQTLVVLALPDPASAPLELRLRRYPLELAAQRARAATGETSVTAVGSGRYRTLRPRSPGRDLLRIDLKTGDVRRLASGAFADFEVSPDGRRAALLTEGEDIPLDPGRPVQGAWGVETTRTGLTLVDLATGDGRALDRAWDVLGQLLRWSPTSDELLIFARQADAPWTGGALLRVDAAAAAARPVGQDLRPVVSGRPAVVRAGWLGRDPIVFARPVGAVGAGRADWFRLAGDRTRNLTHAIPAPAGDPAILWREALWLVSGGRLWRVDRAGAHPAWSGSAPAIRLVAPAAVGLRPRAELSPRAADQVSVALQGTSGPQLHLGAGRAGVALAAGAQVLAAGPSGAVVRTPHDDGPEVLSWVRPGAPEVSISAINGRLSDVDPLRIAAVHHRGPRGEHLTSWLMRPAASVSRPPLVVWPYPGSAYPTFPDYMDARRGGGIETPTLLVGQGYAVLIPSLPRSPGPDGPAAGLADQVLAIVDAAAADPALRDAFDPDRLGIWGASFGGYGALAVLGQTDRFAAAIVQAAPADLFSMHGDYGLKRLVLPQGGVGSYAAAGWTEDLQGGMGAPPWADPDRYVRNSPVLTADRIRTPLMIVHGELDTIPIGQAQEMFSSLQRQDKDAVLVTYWGEGHAFASPGNIRDYYARAFAWLDEHLRRGTAAARVTRSAGPAPGPASAAPRLPPSPPP